MPSRATISSNSSGLTFILTGEGCSRPVTQNIFSPTKKQRSCSHLISSFTPGNERHNFLSDSRFSGFLTKKSQPIDKNYNQVGEQPLRGIYQNVGWQQIWPNCSGSIPPGIIYIYGAAPCFNPLLITFPSQNYPPILYNFRSRSSMSYVFPPWTTPFNLSTWLNTSC